MRTHVVKTPSSCFAVLRQIRSVRRSVSRPSLQTLVASLVLTKLDYGCAILAGLPANLLDRLQSVLNAAARLIYGRRKYDHVTPLLRELHWLRVPEHITFRLATPAYRCQHNMAPHYLAVQLNRASSVAFRQRLRWHQRQNLSFLALYTRQSATVRLCDRSSGVEHLDTVRAVL